MDKITTPKKLKLLKELIPFRFNVERRVIFSQNECAVIRTSEGKKLFLKIYRDQKSGFAEFRHLRFFNLIRSIFPGNSLSFSVPEIIDFIHTEENTALVTAYLKGETISEMIFRRKIDIYLICKEMVVATAEIHHFLSSFADDYFKEREWQYFGKWSDCEPRLNTLVELEGGSFFLKEQIEEIRSFNFSVFQFLYTVADGFMCDVYKDANPSNWVLELDPLGQGNFSLFSTDFEATRIVPFIVDLINIFEYAGDYLSEEQKGSLLNHYIKHREKWKIGWKKQISNYNIQLIYDLFGFYRHQEQLLHRIRDFTSPTCHNPKWQKSAYRYHFSQFQSYIDKLYLQFHLHREKHLEFLNPAKRVVEAYESFLMIEPGATHFQ